MFGLWLLVLIIYVFCKGWSDIPSLDWLLLIPFFIQDYWDSSLKKKVLGRR